MLEHGDGLLACFTGAGIGGGIAGQKLDQSRCKLLCGAAWALAFERMPVPLADAEAAMQLLGKEKRLFGPAL